MSGAYSKPMPWAGGGATKPPMANNYLDSHGLNPGTKLMGSHGLNPGTTTTWTAMALTQVKKNEWTATALTQVQQPPGHWTAMALTQVQQLPGQPPGLNPGTTTSGQPWP
jgi:hypothetical protein